MSLGYVTILWYCNLSFETADTAVSFGTADCDCLLVFQCLWDYEMQLSVGIAAAVFGKISECD